MKLALGSLTRVESPGWAGQINGIEEGFGDGLVAVALVCHGAKIAESGEVYGLPRIASNNGVRNVIVWLGSAVIEVVDEALGGAGESGEHAQHQEVGFGEHVVQVSWLTVQSWGGLKGKLEGIEDSAAENE